MKRPDFLVRPPTGEVFILEARTSTDVASGPESSPRGDDVRDFLRQMRLDGYKLGIDELTVGTSALPKKSLRKHITEVIAAHSGDLAPLNGSGYNWSFPAVWNRGKGDE